MKREFETTKAEKKIMKKCHYVMQSIKSIQHNEKKKKTKNILFCALSRGMA